jgi:hypothetical protein
VFENKVLRRIFGSVRDEVTAEWRKLESEEVHNVFASPSIIRMMGEACSRKGRGVMWTRLIWLRIGISGGLLYT